MGEYCWHGHHKNVCPIERLTGTIAERRVDIKAHKPLHEQVIRLKLLKPCSGEAIRLFTRYRDGEAALWARYDADTAPMLAQYRADKVTLWAQYKADRAAPWERYDADEAALWARYRADLATLLARYQADVAPRWTQYEADVAPLLAPILALHKTECGCTEWNGMEIVFPDADEGGKS